jgi:hypothetical protein
VIFTLPLSRNIHRDALLGFFEDDRTALNALCMLNALIKNEGLLLDYCSSVVLILTCTLCSCRQRLVGNWWLISLPPDKSEVFTGITSLPYDILKLANVCVGHSNKQ